ncbi:hypothetical protein [Paludisphaera soli]|uniref:hypothetical protein n=1 Tax=Paludisphaera soli TaxID=2712865 RepID=UPI0013EE09E5|nr:hypothetical protein [Paludisphaera soli]
MKPRPRRLAPLLILAALASPVAGPLLATEEPASKQAPKKKADPAADLARIKALLRDVGDAPRDEKVAILARLDGLGGRSDAARDFLAEFARDGGPEASREARFFAAAVVAGFGKPTRIGPNSLGPGTSLEWYIDLQRGTPISGPRRLKLDPALKDLKVEVARNAKDDLHFQEILWTILDRYRLDFKLDADDTFVIVPMPPGT